MQEELGLMVSHNTYVETSASVKTKKNTFEVIKLFESLPSLFQCYLCMRSFIKLPGIMTTLALVSLRLLPESSAE